MKTAGRGFTLIELSVVLTIIAIVIGMSMTVTVSVVQTARLSATQKKMKTIGDALMQFRLANNRLPCPGDLTLAPGSADYGLEAGADSSSSIGIGTGVCTGTGMLPAANFTGAGTTNTFATAAEGALPAVTLGLSPDLMLDGWGNKFRYAVDIGYTANNMFASNGAGCVNGAITINDQNGITRSTGALYALISHGPDGHGAYTNQGGIVNAGSKSADELTNCHCTSTGATNTTSGVQTTMPATYVQKVPQYDSGDTGNNLYYFDDVVTFKERWQLRADWDKQGGCTYIYVADIGNARVEVLTLTGAYVSQWGSNGGGPGQFVGVSSGAIDGNGNLWVTDAYNNRVQKFSSQGVYLGQLGCGGGTSGASCGGSSSSANGYFNHPYGVAIDPSGNIWVADVNNNRVEKFNSGGNFLLGLGAGYNGVSGSIGSSGSANGQFNFSTYPGPEAIAFDSSGNVWVTDENNSRVQEFSSSGTWEASLGGTSSACTNCLCTSGTCPSSSGWGTGQFQAPQGLAFDSAGDIWVMDGDYLDKFSSSGTFLLRTGVPGTGTGPGQFWGGDYLAIDPSGNVWVSDVYNNRLQEFNSSGTFLSQIGCGGGTNGCNSSPGSGNGQFNNPDGIAIGGR